MHLELFFTPFQAKEKETQIKSVHLQQGIVFNEVRGCDNGVPVLESITCLFPLIAGGGLESTVVVEAESSIGEQS